MTPKEGLSKLKDLSQRLNDVEYCYIIMILKESIKRLPVPLAKLSAGTLIDRIRKNIGESFFLDVHNDLSYIKDQKVIDQYLTEFGRANKPHQSMFYGAVESSLISTQRVTALAETSELYQNPDGVNFDGELFTVSRWVNTKDLFLAEMVFSQDAINKNPDVKRNFEIQVKNLKDSNEEDIDFALDLIIFISEQFARSKSSHHDYKISTAYTNLVLTKGLHGVAYPSVQTKYEGQNIVFPPTVVDDFFKVEALTIQRFYKNKRKCLLNNVKNCSNPNACLKNIIWTDLEAIHVSSNDYIGKYLKS